MTQTDSWFGSHKDRSDSWKTAPEGDSFGRLWRTFMSARVTIAGALVIFQVSLYSLGHVVDGWSIAVCVGYLCATLALRILAKPKPPGSTFDAQWVFTVGVDLAVFSALNFLQANGTSYTPLFALPVLLASVLGPISLALGTAASVTLFQLFDAWWISLESIGDPTSRFLQAGLSGSGFFIVALLANQLALRLAREASRALNSQLAARMQTQVNELVVATLTDGVLVIDANGIVRSANPASQRLLATHGVAYMVPFDLATHVAWQPLVEITRKTFLSRMPQKADVNLDHMSENARPLHVRTRLSASQDDTPESLCVMFIDDLREMEARVRTEKMAAMGRMSAAIAHEIRNPLAAIVQANALLEEDLHDPAHRQLTEMVSQNAQRLAKIVDDVLNISRAKVLSPEQHGMVLTLDDTVTRIAADWTGQAAVVRQIRIIVNTNNTTVAFDPEHLRRILINLLDNALRHASPAFNSIEVATQLTAPGQARLLVWSAGAPLEKTVQTHLFEPFFSSESRSTGLGLYICRELCERYGAMIGYQRARRGSAEGNEFFVSFRPAREPKDAWPTSLNALSA